MADPKDDDRDEEWFKEVYGKEYTGPVRPSSENAHDNSSMKKRSIADAGERDDDDPPPDPNAVPTDFTSREAKVWEAKAKAIERNWKKKKEEELICRICGEYGHFSQGCPTTLGVNRRQAEVVEKVPVKDKRLKPRIIGTSGSTIQGIEKDTGCRLKLEDNLAAGNGSFFVRITGSSRIMVGKAVDAVKRLIDQVQDDRKPHHSRRSSTSHHRGHNASPMASSQMSRMPHDPNLAQYPGQEGGYYDDARHNNLDQTRQMEPRRPWESSGQNGGFPMGGYGQKGGSQYEDRSNPKSDPREDDRGPEADGGFDQQSSSIQTIQALEHSFVQETMQLTKELNDAEDIENARHREAMRDIQEKYQQKMASLRTAQAKRREEFLRQEAQFRQQQYQQYQQPQSGPKYYNYDIAGPPMAGGYNNGARDQQLGYGVGSSDRADALGGGAGYGFRGEGGYYNAQHSYRNSGYESGNVHMGNQGYDAGQYRY